MQRLSHLALALVIFCLVLILALYEQPNYPGIWLDEGFTLQGALNIVRHGQYAMLSSEGFRVLDQPLVANGPGIVLPLAVVFRFFGEDFLHARVLAAVFAAFTAVLFFEVALRLFGVKTGLLASVFLIGYPAEGFLFYGRQVLGLIPSMGYFLAGLLIWLTALERRSAPLFIVSGCLFGVASITKGQYLIILPVLVLVALVDRMCWRQIAGKAVVYSIIGMVLIQGFWYAVQIGLVGWMNFSEHLTAISSSAKVTVFALRPKRIPGSVWYLVRTGALALIGPAILYVAWRYRKDAYQSSRQLLPLLFVLTWFGWYAFVSVGWHRYAVDAIALGSIFTGKMTTDLITYFVKDASKRRWLDFRRWGTGLLLLFILAVPSSGIVQQYRQIQSSHPPVAFQFAEFLEKNIPSSAIIESWEWEIDALVELTFHHPTNNIVDRETARLQFGEENPSLVYDPFAFDPDFLIDGPFSKWTGLYSKHLASGCCDHVVSFGPYDLYRVKPR